MNYYNEFDKYCAQWLCNLIEAGLIPPGVVDTRSIVDVQPEELEGFTQCHFFAGISGWPLALRMAGWPDDRECWTGSPPCQPFSVAGQQKGFADERDLWSVLAALIGKRRPAAFFGEQVAAAIGKHWLDRMRADLEAEGYAVGSIVLPACAVDAPHRRDRIWVAAERIGAVDYSQRERLEGRAGDGEGPSGWPQQDRPAAEAGGGGVLADPVRRGWNEGRARAESGLPDADGSSHECGDVGHPDSNGWESRLHASPPARHGCSVVAAGGGGDVADAGGERRQQESGGAHGDEGTDEGRAAQLHHVASGHGEGWGAAAWIIGHDGKARRVEPGIRLLAHGVPARVGKLRAFGNAIVTQVAAEVIAAYMETRP